MSPAPAAMIETKLSMPLVARKPGVRLLVHPEAVATAACGFHQAAQLLDNDIAHPVPPPVPANRNASILRRLRPDRAGKLASLIRIDAKMHVHVRDHCHQIYEAFAHPDSGNVSVLHAPCREATRPDSIISLPTP